jgi:transposase-like protein
MVRGKKHTAEQVVNLLRQVGVGVANGKSMAQACKEAEIVEQTYYRWRKEYGELRRKDHYLPQGYLRGFIAAGRESLSPRQRQLKKAAKAVKSEATAQA